MKVRFKKSGKITESNLDFEVIFHVQEHCNNSTEYWISHLTKETFDRWVPVPLIPLDTKDIEMGEMLFLSPQFYLFIYLQHVSKDNAMYTQVLIKMRSLCRMSFLECFGYYVCRRLSLS